MRRIKLILLVVVLMVFSLVNSNAVTVLWDATSGTTGLTLSDQSTGVPIGSLVLLGNFNGLSDLTIASFGANITSITNAFQVWGQTTIGTGTSTGPDGIGSFTTELTLSGSGFYGEAAYMVVVNAPTIGEATQVGVFKGPTNGVANTWFFPSNDPDPSKTFAIDDIKASGVLIGTYGTGTFNSDWFGSGANALALIPEPSAFSLVGLGLLGLFGLRRRKA